MCFSVSTDAFTNLCEGRGKAQPRNPVLIISALPANLRDSGAKMADCTLLPESWRAQAIFDRFPYAPQLHVSVHLLTGSMQYFEHNRVFSRESGAAPAQLWCRNVREIA